MFFKVIYSILALATVLLIAAPYFTDIGVQTSEIVFAVIIVPVFLFFLSAHYLWNVRNNTFLTRSKIVKIIWLIAVFCLTIALLMTSYLLYDALTAGGGQSGVAAGFALLLIPFLAIPGVLFTLVLYLILSKKRTPSNT